MAGNAEVKNKVLREILEEIRQEKKRRVEFPLLGQLVELAQLAQLAQLGQLVQLVDVI